MKIAIIVYLATSIPGTLYLTRLFVRSLFISCFLRHSRDREPKWVEILGWYCLPTGCVFVSSILLLFFTVKGAKRLRGYSRKYGFANPCAGF
jgi:hypothetical protein